MNLFACVQRVTTQSPWSTAEPDSGWGKLIYIIDGDQFGDASGTCGSVGMLVAPVR